MEQPQLTAKASSLQLIRSELKAPKSQYNEFGKYNYRNLDDILTALKPLLDKYPGRLDLTDSVIGIGGWHYIEAKATFTEADGSQTVSKAYAREPEVKKGMDAPQITGTASSYARKYALNALFLIDDTYDADTNEYQQQSAQQNQPQQNNQYQYQNQQYQQYNQYGGNY